jgi:hypothetical protein
MIAKNLAELIRDHVVLEVESIDRLYLNGYVPLLQSEGGFVHLRSADTSAIRSPPPR